MNSRRTIKKKCCSLRQFGPVQMISEGRALFNQILHQTLNSHNDGKKEKKNEMLNLKKKIENEVFLFEFAAGFMRKVRCWKKLLGKSVPSVCLSRLSIHPLAS